LAAGGEQIEKTSPAANAAPAEAKPTEEPAAEPAKPATEQIEVQKIEPTDFDFGYQDLKL